MSTRISTRRSTVITYLSSLPSTEQIIKNTGADKSTIGSRRKKALIVNTARVQENNLQENILESVSRVTAATSKSRSSSRLALKDVSNQAKDAPQTTTSADTDKKTNSRRKRRTEDTTEKAIMMEEKVADVENDIPLSKAKSSIVEVSVPSAPSSAVDSCSLSPIRSPRRILQNPLSEKQPKKSILKKSTSSQSISAKRNAAAVSGVFQYTDAALKNIFSVEKAVTFQFHGGAVSSSASASASAPSSPVFGDLDNNTPTSATSAPSLSLSSSSAFVNPSPLCLPSPIIRRRISRTVADILQSTADCDEKSRLLKNLQELQKVGIEIPGILQTSMRKILEDASPFRRKIEIQEQNNEKENNIGGANKLNFEEGKEEKTGKEQNKNTIVSGIRWNANTQSNSSAQPHLQSPTRVAVFPMVATSPLRGRSPARASPFLLAQKISTSDVAQCARVSQALSTADTARPANASGSMKRIIRCWLFAFIVLGLVLLALSVDEEVLTERLHNSFVTLTGQ